MLTLLTSTLVQALEPFERIKNVKIIRVLSDNVIMLDRGLEDGLLRNDHIKLSSDAEGFSSRAICLKATTTTSYWRLYRIPNSEAFSMDYTYDIVGLADREIPEPVASVRNVQHKFDEPAPPRADPGPDPFIVKRDLPERLTERDLLEATGPEKRKLFIEQALDEDQLDRDLRDYRVSVYASPFTRQSINEGESYRYGIRGGNIGSKYRLLTQFEQQQTKLTDPVTDKSVSTRSTSGSANFIIHRLTDSLSSLSVVNYNSSRFSSTMGTPKSHWQFGPIGFTWHIYESKTWEFLDLSYVPLYDMRRTDTIENNGRRGKEEVNGLRHGVRLAFKTRLNERVAIENLLWARPFQELGTWDVQTGDLNLVNDLRMIFNISGNLFVDYNFIYQKDKLWKKLSKLPDTNTINSLNFRYDFDL